MTLTLIEPAEATEAQRIDLTLRAARLSGRVVKTDVSWDLYEGFLEAVGDDWPRMTYDAGTLELEMPGEIHEILKWITDAWVTAYLDEHGINYRPTASTTWRDASISGGLEADASFYIQNAGSIQGRTVDLGRDLPPDLAIEIDIARPASRKTAVYARLGVPEIWRWRDDEITVLLLEGDAYVPADVGRALPDFPRDRLAAELSRAPHADQSQALRAFRIWCREQAGATRDAAS